MDTLKDPSTQAAVLEIFDLYAEEPLPRLSATTQREDIARIAGIMQDIIIAGAPTEPVAQIIDALSTGFYDVYGPETIAALLADLNIDESGLITYIGPIAFRVVASAREAGQLEELLRERLAEFYASPAVLDTLTTALNV